MLVLVCGMHRSGSTLVWQIARQLLDGAPGLRNPRGVSTEEYPAAAANAEDLLMAKVHFRPALNRDDFPDDGARYLYTYRDPRDVVASLYRKGRFKPDDPERGARPSRLTVRRELRGDEFWTSKSDVWIGRYEDFRDDVPGLVRTLAGYLNVPVDDARVHQIVRDVDLAAQEERAKAAREHGVDDDLRVTSNHITDGREGAWRDTLTSDELVAIEAESARWLVEHGYQVETEVGRRKTADLRGEDVAPRAATPPARKPSRSSRRERWGGPLLLLAAILAVLGLVTAFAAPALSVLPWVIAVAAAAVGGYLWGRDGRSLLPRRRT
ncbi:MAG: sulfotransferase domain-containing protein [Candidatus Nanopelagicales bacterium]